ncbi:MAG: Gmad2 immunoglobulin-like domain-containing protein [Candidatus Paceibacterota bacterium]
MKFIRIFLLILIIIGIFLLCTQQIWVPKLVDRILSSEASKNIIPVPNKTTTKADLIQVDYPQPNQNISSPLVIKGKARGNWFFEASFPVVLTNWDGLIIAQGVAQAQGDWMTTEFVPFEATLTFDVDKKAYSNKGALTLQKDNPSGLSEKDDSIEIPVVFTEVK